MRRSSTPNGTPLRRAVTTAEAFTLVELLVVIGIIALLISILLPALGAARRQASAAKCLTQLREIGNALQMYSLESKGWYPPAQLRMAVGSHYNIDGVDFPVPNSTYGAYWFNFLNKYVSKTKMGEMSQSEGDAAQARRSVIWGCSNWEGYNDDPITRSINRNQVGYGMNGYPTFTPTYPGSVRGPFGPPTTETFPPKKEWSWNDDSVLWNNTTAHQIGFTRQTVWGKIGATRCVVADSRFWLAQADVVPANGVIPAQVPEKNTIPTGAPAPQTYLGLWRHGKLPPLDANGFVPLKGKIAYNILYADGHCATATEATEAFRSLRMKFPG